MSTIKAALLGFGTVGQGVYEVIQSHQDELRKILGADVSIEIIFVKDPSKKRDVDCKVTTEIEEVLSTPGLQVVFEAIVGEEPGYSYLQQIIDRGLHVITANKVLFARHGEALLAQAQENGVQIGFEATTAGGTPIIRTLTQLLQVNRIRKIEGILNGTSNYILTKMRQNGTPYAAALEQAQKLGYAEADPSNDVDGSDAFSKLMILSQLAFGKQPQWSQVEKLGIDTVSGTHVALASELGLTFRHVAEIEISGNKTKGYVKPVALTSSHPFSSIDGVDNAVRVTSSIVGEITLQGPGAGKLPTASAMVEDLSYVFQSKLVQRVKPDLDSEEQQEAADQKMLDYFLVITPSSSRVTLGLHPAEVELYETAEKDGETAMIVRATEAAIQTWLLQEAHAHCYSLKGDIKTVKKSLHPVQ
ncbi:homoserine dehydrogenase [Jeotgalibacillus soli]|uniref:Homoserine dehydrogenase n=1 Tax=Jeotgalibacillus soli TaxID=889306 RepID=A0A0C2W7Q8_9BACL|nr:homoserine dehydrogenase [Jeotgalibacillus soli]KIL52048.1 homoserine dehydrogenase [Jeotgalibacillus soli]